MLTSRQLRKTNYTSKILSLKLLLELDPLPVEKMLSFLGNTCVLRGRVPLISAPFGVKR